MEEGTEGEKKSMSAVVIVLIVVGILVGLAVLGTVLLAGITFLWASSIEDDGGRVEVLNLYGEIDGDEDTLTLTLLSGTRNWNDLSVKVDGSPLTTTTGQSSAGEEVVFSSPTWDPYPGGLYEVVVMSIGDNKTIWSGSLIAH